MRQQRTTPAAAGDVSEITLQIRRRIAPYLFGLIVCGAFLGVWTLERFRGIGAEFVLAPGFSAFIFLGVTPAALLLAYLMLNRQPVVAVRGSSVHVASPTFPWRKTILPSHEIIGIETEWNRKTSHARIVFVVTSDQFDRQDRSGPWIKRKDGKLYLDVSNTEFTLEQSAEKLRRALGIPETESKSSSAAQSDPRRPSA